MIFSIHIPKTAGTSFARALQARYGGRLALYYGASDPKTHALLRTTSRKELAAKAPELRDRGIEVLHGHYPFSSVAPAVTDPSTQVWTWLRDPVDRVVSHYAFYRERPVSRELGARVMNGGLELGAFAAVRSMRNLQSRYLRGVAPRDLAFVGVTERFELGLAMLFADAPRLPRRYNATTGAVRADAPLRDEIARLNMLDVGLYAEGLRCVVDRLTDELGSSLDVPKRPDAAGPSLVTRLLRLASN